MKRKIDIYLNNIAIARKKILSTQLLKIPSLTNNNCTNKILVITDYV